MLKFHMKNGIRVLFLSYVFNPRADWDVEIKKYKKVEIEE